MFDDRSQAGRVLGDRVADLVHDTPVAVLALPRGGVPVGLQVTQRLSGAVDFDVFLVRKLGVPDREELAFGAIASGDIRVLNRSIVNQLGLSDDEMERVIRQEQCELQRRERLYRQDRPLLAIRNRTVVLVDDGLATGATMIAAVRAARQQKADRILVAAPVASQSAVIDLRSEADDVICPKTPEPFFAVGYWYHDFEQVSDQEVRDSLARFHPVVSKNM
ncbi:MAG TPA: phosphoribosyltransferase [Bryobacteraceae bacterium]|jgi:putative phosphoribosyl transferase